MSGHDNALPIPKGLREAARFSEYLLDTQRRLLNDAADTHDALVKALEDAESLFKHTWAENGTIHKQMRAALSLAKGGERR